MISAQEWLDKKYPLEVRDSINSLTIDNEELFGSLGLFGFSSIEIFHCISNNIVSLDLSDCQELSIVYCSFGGSVESVIFPNFKQNLKEVLCPGNRLKSLDLSEYPNVSKIWCNDNRLETLKINENARLSKLFAYKNQLTNLEFLNFYPSEIETIDISNNLFERKDIEIFSKFVNLNELIIGVDNSNWKHNSGSFYGSLSSIKELKKLKIIRINGTDIDEGLESLPDDLGEISCKPVRSTDKVRNFYNLLIGYDNYQDWKKHNRNRPSLGMKIGEGGFATVYKGIWNNQKVAVKKLRNCSIDLTSSSEMKIIEGEISLMKSLRNRYIIQYYGLCHDNENLMIMMELADYGSLTDFIRRNKGNEQYWDLDRNFIKQIADGLQYLHTNNVIHRDLKSANILITEGYIAKISDFGLSKTVDNLESVKTGTINQVGTPRYWAPEILISKKPHSFQTDIYSLGMVILEIAKREIPFGSLCSVDLIVALLKGEREIIQEDWPIDIKELIEGCCKEKASERISLEVIVSRLTLESNQEELIAQVEELSFNWSESMK